MNDAALFDATIPVFRHYVACIDSLLSGLPDDRVESLQQRLAPRAFTAAEHLQTALGFVYRSVCPVVQWQTPAAEDQALTRDNLLRHAHDVRDWLAGVTQDDFLDAAGRRVTHTAGMADLVQEATTFVTLFALPNFCFHLSMAFAILRHEGVDIGKADFDGQHVYAAGFHFEQS